MTVPAFKVLVAASSDGAAELVAALAPTFAATAAEVGKKALDAAEGLHPDAAVVDARAGQLASAMAFLGAFKTLAALKNTPIVAVCDDLPAARAAALDAGADDAVGAGAGFDAELTSRVRARLRTREMLGRLDDATQVIYALANAVEAKDAYTEGHTERVGQLAVALGRRAGMDADAQDALLKGGVLHDIGKIGIPNSILNKRGMLTAKERIVMNKHPMIGERICEPLKSIRELLPIIRWHHERLDGTGYPDGLKGNAFPLSAQILQLADIYDAITTDRPYHRARTRDGAVTFMLGEAQKGWRDATLVRLCGEAAEELDLGRTREEDIPAPPAPIGSWRWE